MKKRILAVILCVLMIVSMLPTLALAEESQEESAPVEAITEAQSEESAAIEEPAQESTEEPEPVIQETDVEAEETPTETEETAQEESSSESAAEGATPAEPAAADAEEETESAGKVDGESENGPAETDAEETEIISAQEEDGEFLTAMSSDIIASGACGAEGENVTWTLDSSGLLTISGTGMIKNPTWVNNYSDSVRTVIIHNGVTSIGDNVFEGCTGLTSITIPSSVKSFGGWSFADCSGLTSITIPLSVTSIGEYAFYNCSGLTSLTIPSSVTSILDNVFEGCTGLTSITIPSSVTSIGERAFADCSGLTSVTIPSSVTSIGDRAFGSKTIDTVYIEDLAAWCNISFETFSYGQIPGIFGEIGDKKANRCNLYLNGELITDLVIPEGMTSIADYAFFDFYFRSITIPVSVTRIGEDAFYADSLTAVYYNGTREQWNQIKQGSDYLENGTLFYTSPASGTCGENMTWIIDDEANLTISGYGEMTDYGSTGYPPFHDYLIRTVSIDPGVTRLHYSAFENCKKITDVIAPVWGYFEGCNVTSVTIPEGLTSICQDAFYNSIDLTSITIPSSVTSIGNNAFYCCSNLTSITIPDSVTSIGESAFSECTSLTDVYYGGSESEWYLLQKGPDNEALTNASIHCAGSVYIVASGECGATEADKLSWMLDNTGRFVVQGSGEMEDYGIYADDEGTHEVTAPWEELRNSIQTVEICEGVGGIGRQAFYNCRNLRSVTLPQSLSIIGSAAFMNCTSLAGVSIPAGVYDIGSFAFANCYKLEGIQVAENNEYYKSIAGVLYDQEGSTLLQVPGVLSGTFSVPAGVNTIEDAAFEGCIHLTEIELGSGISYIGNRAFCNCTSLNRMILPSGIEAIMYSTFMYCRALREITIPLAVSEIAGSAFYGCTALTDVYYGGSEVQWNGIEISEQNEPLTAATIHYNSASCQHAPGAAVRENEIAASCKAEGSYDSVVYCTQCGKEISRETITIPKVPHSTELRNKAEATCTSAGYTGDEVCINCGDIINAGTTIAALGHNYVNGVCTRCSEKDPNYDTTLPGDINGDGKVNALDLVRLKRAIAGENVELVGSGDTTGDGKVNALDLVRLKRYLAGENVELH